MEMKFQLSQPELEYLIMLTHSDETLKYQKGSGPKEGRAAVSHKSLIEKGYIQEEENRQPQVLVPLMTLMQSILICDAAFCAVEVQKDGKRQSFGFYFYEGRIAFAEQKGQQYDLIEVPSLPLAAGMLANRIEIKRESAEIINEIVPDEAAKDLELGTEWGQAKRQWTLIGKNRKDKKAQWMMTVMESSDDQTMVELRTGRITVSRPGKTDFFNACMSWMQKAHAAVRG